MNNDLDKRIADLEAWKASLEMSHSIPLNIDQSFRSRFTTSIGLSVSSKSATSENHAVNESGSGSYSVLGPPDEFLQVNINGVTIYIPAFT